jgi:hypothetical protein
MFTAGLAIRHKGFTLSMSQTFYTDTFEQQRERAGFGTLGLAWYF